MLKFVVLSVLALSCSARPYGASYSQPQTYGQPQASYGQPQALYQPQPQKIQSYGSSYGSSGYGQRSAQGYGQSAGYQPNNNFGLLTIRQSQAVEPVVYAAVQQIGRTVEYRPVPNQEQPIQAQVIEVEPSDNPVHLHFKTRSSTLSLSQSHTPAEAQEVQTSQAQDEPQRLITEVQKPVIQEVREVISPYRQVTQEINPVVESLHTVVTKGEGQRAQYTGAQSTYAKPAAQSSYQSSQSSYSAQPASSYPAISTASLQTNYPAPQQAKAQPSYSNTASVASSSDAY